MAWVAVYTSICAVGVTRLEVAARRRRRSGLGRTSFQPSAPDVRPWFRKDCRFRTHVAIDRGISTRTYDEFISPSHSIMHVVTSLDFTYLHTIRLLCFLCPHKSFLLFEHGKLKIGMGKTDTQNHHLFSFLFLVKCGLVENGKWEMAMSELGR